VDCRPAFAAHGEQVAVEADDLDRRRAFGDFERLDRRQGSEDQTDDAYGGD
jgi:hypothetical protein